MALLLHTRRQHWASEPDQGVLTIRVCPPLTRGALSIPAQVCRPPQVREVRGTWMSGGGPLGPPDKPH